MRSGCRKRLTRKPAARRRFRFAYEAKRLVAQIKLDLLRLALLRKYSPDQPRVPAGSREGGQWTSGGGDGGVRSDSRASPDPQQEDSIKPRVHLAQVAGSDRNSVDLREEEARGGHAIAGHVNKSEAYLKDKVREAADLATDNGRFTRGLATGSFTTVESANKLVNATLAQNNEEKLDRIARGQSEREFATARFSSRTGYEAYLPTYHSQPYVRDTYEVGVVIVRDRTRLRGWRIQSAFPRR